MPERTYALVLHIKNSFIPILTVTQVDPNEIFLELEKEHTNRPSAASDKVVESIIEHFNRLNVAIVRFSHKPLIFLNEY